MNSNYEWQKHQANESLAEWEQQRAALFSDPEFQQSQAGSDPFFESGRIEFYTVEADLE